MVTDRRHREADIGELIALRRSEQPRSGDAGAAPVVRLRSGNTPASAAIDLHNVVPFVRSRVAEAPAPEVMLPAQAARLPVASPARERLRLAAFAALSLAVHAGLFVAFWREPEPLASIGLEVISVELVIGATAPAGVAQAPSEQDAQAAAPPADPQPVEPEQKAEQQATEQPQTVQVAPAEKAPEPEPEPAEPKPSVAMVESPQPDMATATPHETPPGASELSLLPQPAEKPAEPKPEPKPAQAAPPKPVKNAALAPERRRIAAPTSDSPAKQAKVSAPSTAANNVGVGRSDNNSNYVGIVSAHLRRYQQYPSDARSRGDQGTATVTFGLDGVGRVTSVNLARASGISSIDGEVTAMVRRASPFPAPPSGRGMSFTVPVSFRLN